MKNVLFRKSLIIGIVILFVGAGIVPSICGDIGKLSSVQNEYGVNNTKIEMSSILDNPAWLWAKQAGGSSADYGFGISVDSSGNSYVTGYFQGTASFGPYTITSSGPTDVFVAKLDSNGNWQWAKQAGGSSADIGHGISVDSSGIPVATPM